MLTPRAYDENPEGPCHCVLANPLVGNWEIARPLLDALLEANLAHLPRFASA